MSNEKELPAIEHSEGCCLCGKKLRKGHDKWVRTHHGRVVKNDVGPWDFDLDSGYFQIGNTCAKKFGPGYVVTESEML